MSKHTPEPWYSYASTDLIVTKDDGIIADLRGSPTATMDKMRIVACVNACQGLADPAAEIAALREQVATYERITDKLTDANVALNLENTTLREAVRVLGAEVRGCWRPGTTDRDTAAAVHNNPLAAAAVRGEQ